MSKKYRYFKKTDFIPDNHPEKAEILDFLETVKENLHFNRIKGKFKRCPYWELENIKNYYNLLVEGFKWQSTLEKHIQVFGKFGKELYEDWLSKCLITPENLKKKYPNDWEERWENFRKKCNTTSLETFKRKFGEEEGLKKYQEYCKKQGENSHFNWKFHASKGMSEEEAKALTSKLARNGTLENTIEKWGDEEGKRRYNERGKRQGYKISLKGYLERYGEEEGWKKYRRVLNKKGRWLLDEEGLENKRLEDYIEEKSDYKIYRRVVTRYTDRSKKYLTKPVKSNPSYKYLWALDHKVSVWYGFNNNIPACIIGSVHNLEYISMRDNSSKGKKNSMDVEELLEKFFAEAKNEN